jgi:hypothetical protein
MAQRILLIRDARGMIMSLKCIGKVTFVLCHFDAFSEPVRWNVEVTATRIAICKLVSIWLSQASMIE